MVSIGVRLIRLTSGPSSVFSAGTIAQRSAASTTMFDPAAARRSVSDLIAAGQREPLLNYGSAGVGTSNHMSAALLQTAAKARYVHVPYKGATPY
ncbi:hypothetical protein L602_001700000530 [Cupriavidus gilardii J11]|uniref:Tripartite tricarboxylate transporter substrate binding protein n=1 Tax=Cupriavidus gilardii J11 TaxID=936133 RepID=A0A562BQL3_9BURK|nr:hypothetical protein L602_001700000530 [Cupriavidus gilardii J11]